MRRAHTRYPSEKEKNEGKTTKKLNGTHNRSVVTHIHTNTGMRANGNWTV